MKIENKRVLVVGMARSGIASAQLLLQNGATPILYDNKNEDSFNGQLNSLHNTKCEFQLGTDVSKLIPNSDLVVISPGVPIDSPIVKEARNNSIPLIGELELGYSFYKGEIVAVSGTNGKTTTVTLIGKIFENAGKNVSTAGNIGNPLSNVAINSKRGDYAITEVSSFQLESIKNFKPHIAALLNITEDHLNRHKHMNEYIRLKKRIFEHQTKDDFAILNREDKILYDMAKDINSNIVLFSSKRKLRNGVFVENGKIISKIGKETKQICEVDKLLIIGEHNLENALAATAVALCSNIPIPVIRHTLQTFIGVEHRIEKVRELDGITYINDSKATNIDSAQKAIISMKNPTVLILGGYDKHTDFAPLAQTIINCPFIQHIITIGDTASMIEKSLSDVGYSEYVQSYSLEDAVKKAKSKAKSGWNVLLSPACASFDMFIDYEDRGNKFKDIVNALT